MERRLLFVFALTFLAIVLFQKFFFKQPPPTPPQKPEQAAQSQQAAKPGQPATVVTSSAAATPVPAKQASDEQTTTIENDLYKVTFTNKGGVVKSWILKKFTDNKSQPLELLNQAASEKFGYPLSMWTHDQALRDKLNSALYVLNASGSNAPAEITFEFSDGDLAVTKKLKFDHSYEVHIETAVTRGGFYVQAFPAWPAGFGDATVPASYAAARIEYFDGSDVKRISPDPKGKDLSGGNTLRGTYHWAGTVDQYFGAIFLPDRPAELALVTLQNELHIPKNVNNPKPNETTLVHVLGAAVGNPTGPTVGRLFVGPKTLDVLDKVHAKDASGGQGVSLRRAVDFGFFGFIAEPLFLWLRWTYHHVVSNWGWAIILLTVIIYIALLPLRLSSMKSALKMQKVAPQMKAIQDKYKKYSIKDPRRQEMNAEIGALYKQHKVNPVGGCLPLLIQMPFLFAFYSMLNAAIELRHAKFMWLADLSAPDPYYILPIAIVLSTVLMQRMTPQAGMDPTQQRMMNIMMPVMLGFFSYTVASGLGLYWVTGTIVSIVQQWVMNRTELGREIREEAEKRARKAQLKK
jgi:YidC/Oxa1 family membrane protein insertase